MLRQALDAIDREDNTATQVDDIASLATQHRRMAFKSMSDIADGITYKSSAVLPAMLNISPNALPASGDDLLTRVSKQVYIVARLAAELAAAKANSELAARFALPNIYDPIKHMQLIGAQTVEYNKLTELSRTAAKAVSN
jgi:hypothetical protein